MPSLRLTEDVRKKIHHALMKRAFVERQAAIDALENSLALECYNLLYTPKEQAAMKRMAIRFFCLQTEFRVEFAERQFSLVRLAQPLPFAYNDVTTKCLMQFDAKHALTRSFHDWRDKAVKLEKERNQLSAETKAILASCGTVKKLSEHWPEIAPLLKQLGIPQEQPVFYPPAITHNINRLLDLPPGEKAA